MKVKRNKLQSTETLVLILLPFISSVISIFFNLNALWSVVLFLVLPSIVLSLLKPKSILKSTIFSVFTIPVLLIIDYISHIKGQWIVPYTSFNFKIFNVVPVEDLLWVFFLTYATVMFYEYYLDTQKKRKEVFEAKFIKIAIIFVLIPSVWFILGFNISNSFFDIPYFYLIWGTIGMLIPLLFVVFKYPSLFTKLVWIGLYFFYLTFLYEITALYLGWWYFPEASQFIGWVNLLGLKFPLEEFGFWLVMCAMATITWYEFWDDDMK